MTTITKENKDKINFTISKYNNIAIIGLGYVGLPLCIEFARKYNCVGFDVDGKKINQLNNKIRPIDDITQEDLNNTNSSFSSQLSDLKESSIFVVTVPTPIKPDNTPDLTLIQKATEMLSDVIKEGDIVVYESTVYPGVTDEICVPILENGSGLKFNHDFFVGYSPERLSPGETNRTITKITKIVAGSTPEVAEFLEELYGSIIPAGIYKAASIKVAEAAKIVENVQRDLNVALMNELSIIFNKMDISTLDVIDAASTKWNFMKMTPGLVGGHCIGVDPYYLTYKAESLGYHPQVILSGRRINDGMGKFVAEQVVKMLIKADKSIRKSRIGILGVTFKENVADIRNSKVIDVINELQTYDTNIVVTDPHADSEEVKKEYGFDLVSFDTIKDLDALIIAVPHNVYKDLNVDRLLALFNGGDKVVFDIRGCFRGHEKMKSLKYYALL
jgi:UDP-N-acetyl-D-glucosamine/UDP-N-acetyl-D-galactosamine dehydrogenase